MIFHIWTFVHFNKNQLFQHVVVFYHATTDAIPITWIETDSIRYCRDRLNYASRLTDGKRRYSDLLGVTGEPADFDCHEARRID